MPLTDDEFKTCMKECLKQVGKWGKKDREARKLCTKGDLQAQLVMASYKGRFRALKASHGKALM